MSKTSDQPTGEIWGRREYLIASGWLLLAIVLLLLPFCLPCGQETCAPTEPERPILHALPWALGGGLLGALLSVLSIQMVQGSLKQRVRRGLVFEPPVGALVAFFVYLGAQLGIVTFNMGESTSNSEFARWVLLGGLSGFAWDVVIGRVRARIADAQEGA